jgi:peptide/nickel transport system permease protein
LVCYESQTLQGPKEDVVSLTEPFVEPVPSRGMVAMQRSRRVRAGLRPSLAGTSVSSAIALGAGGLLVLIALAAPLLAPHDPTLPAGIPLQPPGSAHWLGTDEVGRDIFSRVLLGIRSSCLGALIVIAAGVIFGSLVGLVAGTVGGFIDAVLMRITDVFLALPGTVLAVALVAAMGPSFRNTLIGMSIVWWPLYARLVRSEVRRLRASPHIDAARLADAGRLRLVFRHLLPGAVPIALVTASLDVSAVVLSLAGLSFLGLGAPAPAPELGAMTARGMTYIFDYWWVPIMPAIGVSLVAVIANFGGDAIRDRMRDR